MNENAMLNHAKVSVVIPCYQCSETLTRAVASVANQTLLPFEVILIDDASPDNGKTVKVMHDLVEQYAGILNIKLVRFAENKGAANARNAGWEIATQPYIAFLDSDDAWHPKKIEIQYGFMQNNIDVALCGHGVKIVKNFSQSDRDVLDFSVTETSKKKMLFSNPFVTPSVMLRRDISLRFDSRKRYVDDHLLWLEIFFNNHKMVKISSLLASVYKPLYGSSGLSSHLWAMEISELDNYWQLFEKKHIGILTALFFSIYSFAKYIRRVIIVCFRRLKVVSE